MMKGKWKFLAIAGLISALAGGYHGYNQARATITSTTMHTSTALGNGATTSYTIGFTFQDNDEIEVYLQDESTTPYTRTLLVYGAGAGKYTITGGDPGTTVVMGTAPSTTQRLFIKRVTPHTQTVDYSSTEAFPADDHESQMDRFAQALQEFDYSLSQKIGLDEGSSATVPTFPDPQPSSYVRYNGSSELDTRTYAQVLSDISALKTTNNLSDITNATTARTNLGLGNASTLDNDSALWNARKIQGKDVSNSSPSNGNVLVYRSGTNQIGWESGASAFQTLADGYFWVGNSSSLATAVLPSGDVTFDDTGAFSIGSGKVTSTHILDGTIVNADINASAAIADTKLGTISTAGKVSNSATTAASANTASAIVARDGSGSFSAGTITATLSGTATNATNGTTASTSTNATYYPLFAASSSNGNQPFNLGTSLTFNPSSGLLSATTFSGSGASLTGITNTNLSGSAAITNANLASMSGLTIKGNQTGSSAAPSDLTPNQVTNMLTAFVGAGAGANGASGIVPAPSAGQQSYVLLGNGSWSAGIVSNFSVASLPGGWGSSVANSSTTPALTLTAASPSYEISNVGLSATQSSNILTVALKQKDASTNCSSGSSACVFGVQVPGSTTSSFNQRSVTASQSLALSAQTTVGFTSGASEDLYAYEIDSDGAGTMKMGVSPISFDDSQTQTTVKESDTVTITNASPGVLTISGNNYANGDAVILTTSGGLPTGLSVNTVYYVVHNATDGAGKFRLAATLGGADINTSSAGSGTHTCHIANRRQMVSDGYYTSAAFRNIGRIVVANTTGNWGTPTAVGVAPFNKNRWRVDAYISGANPDLSGLGSTYVEFNNSSFALTMNPGSIPVVISCSSTGDNTGSGCSAGNPEWGIIFTPPTTGWVKACTTLNVDMDVGGAAAVGNIQVNHRVVLTANGSQTVTTGSNEESDSSARNINTNMRLISHVPLKPCGYFYLTAGTRTTLRDFIAVQANSGTVNGYIVETSTPGNFYTSGWTVEPVIQ